MTWWPESGVRIGIAVLALVASSGCAALGVVSDGTTVSWGKANRGGITAAARLPDEGDGYRVAQIWRERGLRYGTDELIDTIVAAGRRVEMQWPGSLVTVADLSPERGGPSQWHRSHQSGRDVDLMFFVTDEAGRPVEPEDMRRFDADGKSIKNGDKAPQVFDTARNWSLIRALLEVETAEVQRIFIFDPLKELLLDHARALGEPDHLIARADLVLGQPGDSARHDDHMHVRVLCAETDKAYGCRDYGVLGVDKKPLKAGVPAWTAMAAVFQRALFTPMPGMLALVGFPILR